MKGVKCSNCKNFVNEWCEKKFDSPCPTLARDCANFVQKTNGDRIRSMTDEELAQFLDSSNSQGCVSLARDCEASCERCITKWLKQPYKESGADGR